MQFKVIKQVVEDIRFIITVGIALITALGYTVNDNMNKEKEITETVAQVTAVANHFSPPKTEHRIVQKCNCKKLLIIHLEKDH